MARRSGPRLVMEAARAATDVYDRVIEAISRFLAAARRGILGGGPGTPPDLGGWPGDSVWMPLVLELVAPAIRDLYGTRWRSTDVLADPEQWIATWMDTVTNRLRDFPATSYDYLRGVLADGINNGESTQRLRDRVGAALGIDAPSRAIIDRIARLDAIIADPASTLDQVDRARTDRRNAYAGLRDTDRVWQYRAERIARTESGAALNAALAQSLYAQSMQDGDEVRLRWYATRHPPSSVGSAARTRSTHRAAHGQTVAVGERFDVGGASLAFPGDPTGPPQEVINCRCVVVPV